MDKKRCEWCRKEFETNKFNPNKKFCCQKCNLNKYRDSPKGKTTRKRYSENHKEEKKEYDKKYHPRKTEIIRTCIICNKLFESKHGMQKTCSLKCRKINHKIKQKEGGIRWRSKPENQTKEKARRQTLAYKIIKKKSDKKYYKKNKEKILSYHKQHYKKHKKLIKFKPKNCVICNKLFIPRNRLQITCGIKKCMKIHHEYKRKEIMNRPKSKAREKERRQTKEYKANRKIANRKYNIKPRTKIKLHRRKKNRRKTDSNYRVRGNIRAHFRMIMKLYSRTGKIMPIKKYGIDIEGIIKHLGPKPNDGRNYEVDHIVPASMFDHNDSEQIKKAWHPTNFQWLTREINIWKSNRLIKPPTNKEKEKLQLELEKK